MSQHQVYSRKASLKEAKAVTAAAKKARPSNGRESPRLINKLARNQSPAAPFRFKTF